MRYLPLVAFLLAPSLAAADAKAIEKAVKTNLAEIANMSDDDKLAITKDATLVNERGTLIDLTNGDGCVKGAVASAFYDCTQGNVKHVPGKITSGASGDVGWFQLPYVQRITGDDTDGNTLNSKLNYRIGGIAIKDGHAWKIAAAMYVPTMTDKELFKSIGRDMPKGDATLTGDKKLAGVVAGWFKTGFAPAAAKQGTLIASGTSLAEFKSAAAATKLAASWDKLKLAPVTVDAKLIAGGKIGWVTVAVRIPRKKDGKGIAMTLAVIVVPDGDGWRWVSLMYQGPFEPSR